MRDKEKKKEYDRQRWRNLTKEEKTRIRKLSQQKPFYKRNLEKLKIERKKKIKLRNCIICGKEYFSPIKKKVCCGSKECRKKLYYHKEKKDEYRKKNKDKINKWCRENYYRYKGKYNKRMAEYKRKRLKEPLFKLKHLLRDRINKFIKYKGFKKTTSTIDLLGCSWEFFKNYIEIQFTDKMSWKNYGSYWEIDHILPLKVAIGVNDLSKLNHFTNLRPLKASENRSKGAKLMEMEVKNEK